MNKCLAILAAMGTAALLGLPSVASADPISSCTTRPNSTNFDCQVYEGPEGTPETQRLALPTVIGSGFLVMLEDGTRDANGNFVNTDISNWSDVVDFFNVTDPTNNSQTGFLDFISDPDTFSLLGVTNPFFLAEDQSGVTSYFSGGVRGANNDYFLHSDVPEPTGVALIGAALLSLLGFGVMRKRADG